MVTYEDHLRPLLFRLDAERAHSLAQLAMRWGVTGRLVGTRPPSDARLVRRFGSLECASPIGLAPGFDKDGRLIRALDHLGFGYLTVGSITPLPRPGNPRPRLVRYPHTLAIGNSMGLPSVGVHKAARYLSNARELTTPVMASIAGFGVDEVCDAFDRLAPLVHGIELGLICPNTHDGSLAEVDMLSDLLQRLEVPPHYPVIVKLPPYHDEQERQRTMQLLDLCVQAPAITGVSISGTRTQEQPGLAVGRGSISGAPTFQDALRMTTEVVERAPGLVVKAAGGVLSGGDAARLLNAGATSVEVYSGLVYRGPRVARKLCDELLEVYERGDSLPGTAQRRGDAQSDAGRSGFSGGNAGR